jgi:two-component system, NtrC family, sensor kinase
VLFAAMLAAVLLSALAVGAVAAVAIARDIRRESQERVNHELDTARALYDARVQDTRRDVAEAARALDPTDAEPEARLAALRRELRLDLLGACDLDGKSLFGSEPATAAELRRRDPLIVQARLQPASGTMALSRQRVLAERGNDIVRRTGLPSMPTADVLFTWAAAPIRDTGGRVRAVAYGGRAVSGDQELVDRIRALSFGTGTYGGKPLGTATFFLGENRVATNVLGPDQGPALGTRVAPDVAAQVLGRGERWQNRASVVGTWYLSAYEPLRDAEDRTVGMLYVGLLEAPYVDLERRLLWQVLGAVGAVAVLASLFALWLVRRITTPIGEVTNAAARMAQGERDHRVDVRAPYRELGRLLEGFHGMQHAIADRDQHLLDQNRELGELNERLERVNQNYMTTLRFVTHELRSPLAAVQSLIDAAFAGFADQVPEQLKGFLLRMKRNLEELQDMVKNYLDLSRAERGEFVVHPAPIELWAMVIEPVVEQVEALFGSRSVTLEIEPHEPIAMVADAELLRIAAMNYLSNAAKYASEKGRVRLSARAENDRLVLSVWNEGPGFTAEEGLELFKKFSRLKNANTRGKRGSGLGLYLCQQIAELHGGKVSARSEAGQWAEFTLEVPLGAPATPAAPAPIVRPAACSKPARPS